MESTRHEKKFSCVFIGVQYLESEQITHLFLFFLLFFLNSGRGSLGGGSGGGSGNRGGNSESLRVLNTLLEGLGLLEEVVSSQANRNKVLVGVEDNVGEGRERRIVKSEGEGSNVGNTSGEVLEEVLRGGVKELSRVDNSIIEDVGQLQTIGEGTEVQHLHEGSLRGTDLLTFLAKVDVLENFDATSGDLGGNVEGGEEGGLGWLKGGDLLRNNHILRGKDTSLSLGRDTRLQELFTETNQVLLGENKTNVTLDDREEGFPLRVSSQVILDGLSHEGLNWVSMDPYFDAVEKPPNKSDFTYVSTQENGGTTTEAKTDLLHVVGSNLCCFSLLMLVNIRCPQ